MRENVYTLQIFDRLLVLFCIPGTKSQGCQYGQRDHLNAIKILSSMMNTLYDATHTPLVRF